MSTIPFEVEAVVIANGVVLARQLTKDSFVPGENPRLAGIPIERALSVPRALNANGEPRLDLFAFRPIVATDLAKLEIGQAIELEPENAS